MSDLEDILSVKIKVIGVGGGGGNAVNRMIAQLKQDVDFIAANTDMQVLFRSKAQKCVQLGPTVSNGRGAGADPVIGKKAAEESLNDVITAIDGASILFITAGEGGGTGTGASPIIAQAARDLGIVTVAIVTKPFDFEGKQRASVADEGIAELRKYVDGMIVIPNQRLFKLEQKDISVANAFRKADDILTRGVCGITELIQTPGIINLDFADLRTILCSRSDQEKPAPVDSDGKIWLGLGSGYGPERAADAIKHAMSYNLLDYSIDGAKNVLYNVVGHDVSMEEMDTVSKIVSDSIGDNAKVIFGFADPYDEYAGQVEDANIPDEVRVTIVASGLSSDSRPATSSPVSPAARQSELRYKDKLLEENADDSVKIPAILRRNPGFLASAIGNQQNGKR